MWHRSEHYLEIRLLIYYCRKARVASPSGIRVDARVLQNLDIADVPPHLLREPVDPVRRASTPRARSAMGLCSHRARRRELLAIRVQLGQDDQGRDMR